MRRFELGTRSAIGLGHVGLVLTLLNRERALVWYAHRAAVFHSLHMRRSFFGIDDVRHVSPRTRSPSTAK